MISTGLKARTTASLLAATSGVFALLAAGCLRHEAAELTPQQKQWAAAGFDQTRLDVMLRGMDPSARQVALRHDPYHRQPDYWGRPAGWERLDIAQVPDLGIGVATGEAAQALNALKPAAPLPVRPMRPFVLNASGADRERALRCLTQAIYYEAAREPPEGQQAVAQVVLNRVRHPAYPKSICGVVYQGSLRATGCQFTFTCDGALAWAPNPVLWARAAAVARRAVSGYVDKAVGPATHYHASYVAPYWAPTLVKLAQVGAHIFYRWTGPWGEPPAFTGRYAGHEADLSPQLLSAVDARTQGGLLSPEKQGVPANRTVTLAVAGEVRTYTVADAAAPDGARTRVQGVIQPARRKPTADEIKRINDSLAAMERTMADKPGEAAPAAPNAAVPAAALSASKPAGAGAP